jgi:hypothetical protein
MERYLRSQMKIFTDGKNTPTFLLLGGLMALICSCGPNAIAPLPSPENPDSPIGTSIMLSSLTVDDDSPDEAMVALIGIEGAVGGEGHIRITTPRKDGSIIFPCTAKGSFVATLMALPGDLIAVSFMDSEERESLPIEFHVHSYEKPVARDEDRIGGGPPPADGKANQPGDSPSPIKHTEDSSNELALILNYANGIAHFTGPAGFIGAMDVLMIANEGDGNIYYTSADSSGAVDFSIPAQPGDLIVLFAINPLNNTMTTPASQFEIPGKSKPTADAADAAEGKN